VKVSKCTLPILVGVALAFNTSGCNKKPTVHKPTSVQDGIEQLRIALDNANEQVKSNLYSGVSYNLRYEKYEEAMMALEQIINDPSLNESQKKLANEVMELLKQTAQGGQPAPAAN
jgi:hypothetical protein